MWNWVSKLEELRSQGHAVVAVTLTQSSGSSPREAGAKMLVVSGGEFFGTIGGGHLEELALADAKKCLEDGITRTIRYPLGAKTGQCCGGVVELLFEAINRGPRLYLFGAGHVGQAVCRAMVGTPFIVHVSDERPEWIQSKELPREVIRHEGEWDELARAARWDEKETYVAIMTHRHDTDQDIVEYVVQKPARYIGLIGSRSKWERFAQRLSQRGVAASALERVKCPIGLDVGGKAPQEVAISLAAELLKHYYGR
jgi:xanthine dehydrogenase accessory factor